MLEIKNINIKFNNKECIRNGNFIAYPSSITGIIGESGTGKSSLLYIIGMLSNQQYDYYYHDELLQLNDKEKAEFRNKHISFITQNSILIDTISVEKNIEFYLMQSNTKYTVDKLLEMVKLTDKKKAMPESLSGGERQRVAIACAIAKDSDIILGDEITSALDEDNKKIIMKILRECADQGKTVILVSHERNIIDECDRVYELDHLELKLKKDNEITKDREIQKRSKKVNALKMFELLFHSNRKYNLRRIIFSFLILIILFCGASIFRNFYSLVSKQPYSVDQITKNKVVVVSNISGEYTKYKHGYAIHNFSNFEPLSNDNIKYLNKFNHIDQMYNYYTLDYSMINNVGYTNEMKISVKRKNKVINPKENKDGTVDYDFFVSPIFPEDKINFNTDGIYINNNMAYVYNIEIGDTLELRLNVPYALVKSNVEGSNTNMYSCLGEYTDYQTKVIGVIDSNSEYNELYLKNTLIESLIDEKVNKYKNNEITIYKKAFEGYSTIEDLKPYAKALYIDKPENILNIQNEINKSSNKIYAYNEYQSILELKEENDNLINNTMIISILCGVIFIVASIIIEIFYLKKYKSSYMMLNLVGYDLRQKNKILLLHFIWQMLIIISIVAVIYIITSIPDILIAFKIKDIFEIMKNMPYVYYYCWMYGVFSILHFVVLITLMMLILITGNIGIKRYYDKQDLITWLREK